MPRRPLAVGTWGLVSRTPVLREDGRDVHLVARERRYYRPEDAEFAAPVQPTSWVARARFRDHDGVTRKVEAWGRSAAMAETALLAAMRDRAALGDDDTTPDTRLAKLAEDWLVHEIDDSKRSSNTRQRYREITENHVVPGLGGLMVREVTVGRLDRFLREVADRKGVATAKLCKTVLSGMLGRAARHDALDANPIRDVSPLDAERSEVRALTLDEVRALRASLRADKRAHRADLPDLVDVMLATGCRIGEALAIRWEDVDLEAGTVKITGTVVRVRGQGLTRQPNTKTGKGRTLRLPKFAVGLLMARSVDQDGGLWNVVFPTATGGLREVSTVEWQWRQFRTRNPAWKWVTPHTFRKTVATLVDRERTTKDAAAQLGHASEHVTTQHYVEREVLGPDLADLLQRFGD